MSKEKLIEQLEKANELTNGKPITCKSMAYIILLALELKTKGLTTKDFYKKKLEVE